MKTAGIVSEYNPMHNGHIYQIEETRKNGATHIVSVMSGNYVQRGECAFLDKWTRADIAVNNGVDLVVELPTPWSLDSAENFAYGAVFLLSSLGIDMLSFGSETDDVELLKKCANMENEELSSLISNYIKSGCSYPAALKKSVETVYGSREAEIISSPNSTLGIEYIKALKKLSSDADVLAVKRVGAFHDDNSLCGNFVSASALRNILSVSEMKPYISDYSFAVMSRVFDSGYGPATMKEGERAVLSALRKLKASDFEKYTDDKRGLSSRIYSAVKTSVSIDEFYEKVKTKNVTLAKVRRSIMRTFLEISPEMSRKTPPYIKVLAANEKGIEIIRNIKSDIPVITKHSDTISLSGFAKEVYETECRCTDLYTLFSKKIRACGLEQTSSCNIIK